MPSARAAAAQFHRSHRRREGAVVAGFPADDTEEAILENIRAAGYGQ